MKTQTKLKLLCSVGRLFPVWALRKQSNVVYNAFEAELKAASKNQDREFIEHRQYSEVREYEDRIASIQSRRLAAEAENLFIYLPDLIWEQGNYGDRYLDKPSLSRLFHAVKEQKDKIRDYRLRLAGALTGIIGALIGLLAVWKK